MSKSGQILNISSYSANRNRICVLIAISVPVVLWGCNNTSRPAEIDVISPVVEVEQITRTPEFVQFVTYYGRIEAARKTDLSFEFGGKVDAVLVKEGQFVSEGQPIARLNNDLLRSEREVLLRQQSEELTLLTQLRRGERGEEISIASAEIQRLQSELDFASQNVERTKKLISSGAVTQQERDAEEYRLGVAKAAIEQARLRHQILKSGSREEEIDAQQHRCAAVQTRIELQDIKIEKSLLLAPYSSIVTRRLVDEGAIVAPGQNVVEVREYGKFIGRVGVPPVHNVHLKDVEHLRIDGRIVPVSNCRHASFVNDRSRTIDFLFDFEVSTDTPIFPGQICELEIPVTFHRATLPIPVKALVPSIRGLWTCYVVNSKSRVDNDLSRIERVEVSIIHSDGEIAYVDAQIDTPILVVTSGTQKLSPGMLVRISGNN